MSRIASIASLTIIGIIIADVLIHPQGVAAASKGFAGITTPAFNALLGK